MFLYYLKIGMLSLKRTPLLSSLVIFIMSIGIAVPSLFQSINDAWSANPMEDKDPVLFRLLLQNSPAEVNGTVITDLPLQITFPDSRGLRQSKIPTYQAAMTKASMRVRPQAPDILPFSATARMTDGDFFALFDVPFIHGGAWPASSDDIAQRHTVITSSFNDRVFGGGDNVGRQISLDEKLYTVSGIIEDWSPLPQFFDLTGNPLAATEEIFLPFSNLELGDFILSGNISGFDRVSSFQEMLSSELVWIQYWVQLDSPEQKLSYEAFLSDYISEQQAIGRFQRENPESVLMTPSEWIEFRKVTDERLEMLILLGFLFLLVCMVNSSSVILAKYLKSANEMGMRRALGAGKTDIYFQVMVEIGLIAGFSFLLGSLLTKIFITLLSSYSLQVNLEALGALDKSINFFNLFAPGASPLLLILAISLAGTFLMALYPSFRICRIQPSYFLKAH